MAVSVLFAICLIAGSALANPQQFVQVRPMQMPASIQPAWALYTPSQFDSNVQTVQVGQRYRKYGVLQCHYNGYTCLTESMPSIATSTVMVVQPVDYQCNQRVPTCKHICMQQYCGWCTVSTTYITSTTTTTTSTTPIPTTTTTTTTTTPKPTTTSTTTTTTPEPTTTTTTTPKPTTTTTTTTTTPAPTTTTPEPTTTTPEPTTTTPEPTTTTPEPTTTTPEPTTTTPEPTTTEKPVTPHSPCTTPEPTTTTPTPVSTTQTPAIPEPGICVPPPAVLQCKDIAFCQFLLQCYTRCMLNSYQGNPSYGFNAYPIGVNGYTPQFSWGFGNQQPVYPGNSYTVGQTNINGMIPPPQEFNMVMNHGIPSGPRSVVASGAISPAAFDSSVTHVVKCVDYDYATGNPCEQ